MIEIPNRPSSLSLNLPGGAKMLSRQARPLNGVEIRKALIVMIHQLALELIEREAVGLEGELKDKCIDMLLDQTAKRFDSEWALNRSHVCYPGVGWSIKVNLEKLGDRYSLNSKIELDLALNVRSEFTIGFPDTGPLVGTVEHEQLKTNVPDRMRQESGLPVEVDYVRQDGSTGKAQIKMARTVDVSGGQVVSKDPEIKPSQVMKAPESLPELPAEDLIAEPAEVQTVQPKPQVYSSKPRAEIKRSK